MPTLPAHVQWLVDNRGTALQAALRAQGVAMEPGHALGVLVAADPSPGAHAVQWLCDALIREGMRWEDVSAGRGSKAGQTLDWFTQHRARLAQGARNLEDYTSLGNLYLAIAPYLEDSDQALEGETKGRQLRRAQRQQAYGESIIVCNRPDLIVAVPLSQGAACWWGRGTRWCTAAREDNAFAQYNRFGPLIVVVLPGVALQSPGVALQSPGVALQSPGVALQSPGVTWERQLHYMGKLQLYIDSSGRAQFMNSADANVTREFIDRHWNILGPLVFWAAKRTSNLFHLIPDGVPGRTADMYRPVVQACGIALRDVAPEYIDADMCLVAVTQRSHGLRHVPPHLCTPELCMSSVQYSGWALESVPEHMKTPELCMAAVSEAGAALSYVPLEYRTAQLCMVAARTGTHLRSVPPDLRTRELIELALSANPHDLVELETDGICLQDHELCMIAVQSNGHALRYVHRHLVDAEIALAAVSRNGSALQYVPRGISNHIIYNAAIGQDGRALEYVPMACRTQELCLMAVKNNAYAIKYVPENLRTEEVWLAGVAQNPRIAGVVGICNGEHITQSVMKLAITSDPDLCGQMPGLEQSMVVSCLGANPHLLAWVEPDTITVRMCLDAVGLDPAALCHVPEQHRLAVLDAFPHLPSSIEENPGRGWDPDIALAGLVEALAIPAHSDHVAHVDGHAAVESDALPGRGLG